MTPALDALLCQRHPQLFQHRHADPQTCAMGWGLQCGDGWFDLIDILCESLQQETEHGDAPQAVAMQVKQKWGRLRFSVESATERQQAMIDLAEALSARLCEQCGKPGKMQSINRPLKKWASNASGTLFSKKRVAQTRLRSDCTGQSGLFAGHLAHFGRTYPRAHA